MFNMESFVGYPVEMKEDNRGLLVRSKLNLNKQKGLDLYEDYKFLAEAGRPMDPVMAEHLH